MPSQNQSQLPQLVKAKLKVAPNDPLADPSAKDIDFMFNPQEISFTRNSIWKSTEGTRGYDGLPKVNFGRIEPYTFSLNKLIFDAYETRGQIPKNGTSLMDLIENLKKGVSTPDDATKRPPVYILNWGSIEYFYCVMTKLTYTLTMFLSNGTPVRALVDIDLLQVDAKNMPGVTSTASTKLRTSGPDPTK